MTTFTRSSENRLLRKRGGRTKREDPGVSVSKLSGSMTHRTLATEPSIRALKGKPSQVQESLPKRASTIRKPARKDDGIFANERNVAKRGTSQRKLVGPDDFGKQQDDLFKRGGSCRKASGGKMWIQDAINPSKKGALHKTLGIPAGEKIPEGKLLKAEHSRSPLTRKRANLAATLRGFHKGR